MKLLTKTTFLNLLAVCFSISAYAQLELTEIQFETPKTESSNPSSAAEFDGKVYILIRDGIVVWDLASETWETKEVAIQSGFNSSYIGVVNDKIITFPENVHDIENSVFGREPAILDPVTFEIRGIKDINPSGFAFDRHLLTHNDKVYFLANDGVNGREVWVTDGTNEGTVMLHDMTAGASGQGNIWAVPFLDRVIINYNRSLFWITDGTPSGTSLLKDFGEVIPSLPFTTDQFTTIGTESFFSFSTAALGQVIWKTDGSSEGTVQLTDFSDYSFSGLPKTLGMNGELFAFGTESQVVNYPFRVLKINLSTGDKEEMVYQEMLGSISGVPKVIDTQIYYCISGHSQSSGIYRFNGSTDGVEKLKSIPDLDGVVGEPKTINNGFFWTIRTASAGQELWYSDKTEEGTYQVKDIDVGIYGGLSFLLGVFQNTLFFNGNDGNTGIEPWVSQGTPETTYIIDDFETRQASMQATNIRSVNSNLYFNLNIGGLRPNLFKLAGNKLVDIINQPNFQAKTYFDIEAYQDKVFFGSKPDFQTLYDEYDLYHLFSYDGTEIASTKPISGITSGPREFSVANNTLFFIAGAPSYGDEYWISNGTADGTKMLKDINPGSANGYAPWLGLSEQSGVVYSNGFYYFSAIGPNQGHELWKTDLTEAGTVLVKDINLGTGDSYPSNFTTIGSKVYFTAAEGGASYSSWVTDGTESGTIKLIDQFGSGFYQLDGQTYIVTKQYVSESNKNLFKIWETDGTLNGTSEWQALGEFQSIDPPVAQIQSGLFFVKGTDGSWSYNLLNDSNEVIPLLSEHPDGLSHLFATERNVYFFTNPEALWVTDGTTDGTIKIDTDFDQSLLSSNHLTAFEDRLILAVDNTSLWSLNLFEAVVEAKADGEIVANNEPINIEGAIGQSTTFEVEVFNKGYSNINISGEPKISLSGPDANQFSVLADLPDFLGIKKSASLTIGFNPSSLGEKQASLSIDFNEGAKILTFNVIGQGIKGTPYITFSELPSKSVLDEPFDLSASADTDQEITFSSSNAEIASIVGTTVTIHKAGTVVITASVEETEFYTEASFEQTLVIEGVEQTITFEILPEKTFGDAPFELSATASSELEVTFTSDNTSVASIEGNIVTVAGAGSATIIATQSGNDSYQSTSTTQVLTVNKATQTISFGAPEPKTYGDANFTLTGSSSSSLSVTFSSSDPTTASVSGSEISILKAGTVTITASQPGNQNYLAASPIEQTLAINKATQAITFPALAAKTFGDVASDLSASSSSGLAVIFASSDATVATVNGASITILKAGSTTITASQPGSDNYLAAPAAEQVLTVNKAGQTLTFEPLPAKVFGDEPVELSATASTALPITFSSSDPAIARIEGTTLSILKAGLVTITASQTGNDNYNATSAQQSLTINKATQTISFEELPALTTDDESLQLTAQATSGLPVMLTSADETIGAIEGNTLVIIGGGETTITASQVGDENFLAAEEVVRVLIVEEVTGTGENLISDISVYPNPTVDRILIRHPQLNRGNYTVVTLDGAQIEHGSLDSTGMTEIGSDVLQFGVYMLIISNDEITVSFKIVKGGN